MVEEKVTESKTTERDVPEEEEKEGGKMDSYRMTAMIVGVLFIIATAAGVLSAIFLGPVFEDPDDLSKAAGNENQVIIGSLCIFTMAVAVAGIAIVIYPVLRKQNEVMALGFVGARVVEGVLFIVNVIIILVQLKLSQEFVKAGTPDASHFQTTSELLIAAGEWTGVIAGLVFGLSALIFYYLLYVSKLIPRWLSMWGFIGAILYFLVYLVAMFGTDVELFVAPLAVNEMALGVWLIFKGFNPVETTSLRDSRS